MNTERLKKQWNVILGLLITAISFALLVYGYSSKVESGVTAKDTTIIYGLIALTIGVILIVTGFYRSTKKTEEIKIAQTDRVITITQAALLAALCYIGFQYFKIPIPVGTEKTALHIGNTFCVLAALLLGGLWGGLAGSIGMTIADLTSDYVTSAPKTLILKLCIGLIVGFVAHKVFHISKEHNKKKILRIAILSSTCGLAFNVIADQLVGYFYKRYVLNIPADVASVWAKIGASTTFVNAIAAVIVAVILYMALRPALLSSNLLRRID